MTKTTVLAICGKSCSGKTTLSKDLLSTLSLQHYNAKRVVSATSRPPRQGEIDGYDYFFLPEENFLTDSWIEKTQFRDWWYGTPTSSFDNNKLNIAIFNPAGIKTLLTQVEKYDIIIVYLKENIITRLWRSWKREYKWKLEYFRRAWTDYKDFRKMNLENLNDNIVVINVKGNSLDEQSNFIIKQLKINKILGRFL